MIKLDMPVIVEGKYDKITLENVVDALIITTDGFSIFKNKEKCRMIRLLAQKNGVVVITDSDHAGNQIRAFIKNIVGDSKIINVYIPQLSGKEKRKAHSSAQGFLGVEGMSVAVLENALKKSGVCGKDLPPDRRKITKTDMFAAGLSGVENSGENRKSFLKRVDLPVDLSPNAMLDILNTIMTFEEFCEVTKSWRNSQIKS